MVTLWHPSYTVDHHPMLEVMPEVTAMQVLEKLDFNDSTVQHVVLASIPPQQPAASMPEVDCSSLPYVYSTHHHVMHVCFPPDISSTTASNWIAMQMITLHVALPACLCSWVTS